MTFSNKLKIGVAFHVRAITTITFCLVVFISFAQAEQPYDITSCHSGTTKILYSSKELTIVSAEGWGIIMSNHENKFLDNCTFHVITLIQVMPDKIVETGYVKVMDPGGDFVIAETSRVGKEAITKFLHGTGKYKGITGGHKSERIVYGRIPPDAAAACSRSIGTFELPKK
jgi:hypothetical protein